jgi:hypothetical protein
LAEVDTLVRDEMPASPASPEGIGATAAAPQRNPVIQEMESILASAPFRTSRQCQRLLRYIVEQTLDGHGDALRERVIGMAVFDRRADYDPGQDPVVRIRAADVRKRLAQYYQAVEGVEPAVAIDVPPGSYRATFRVRAVASDMPSGGLAAPEVVTLETVSALPAALPARGRRRAGLAAGVLGLLVVVTAAILAPVWLRSGGAGEATAFDQFWAPFFNSAQSVLLCMGTNAVYRLSDSYIAAYRREHHMGDTGPEFYADLPLQGELATADIVPTPNTFVGIEDVTAATDVVALLVRHGKSYGQRFSGDLSFADLRHVPAVLVGGFNNRWTLEMTGDLRYRMVGGHSIVDTQTKRVWSTAGSRPDNATDDYALISRLVDGKTGAPLLAIAGIGTYGTQAAGEFVSSRAALAGVARSAPAGWAQKNVQIVLHVRVVEFAPSTTEVVAERFW